MVKSLVIRYTKVLLSLCLLDSLWLYTQFDSYKAELGSHLAPSPSFAPIVAFYLLYAYAICFLVAEPERTSKDVCLRALVLGITAYGTYDLTNAGTLRDYSLSFALKDMAWGSVLTLMAALSARFHRAAA